MITSHVAVQLAFFVIFSPGKLNLLINVNCQAVYRDKGEIHYVCSGTEYLAEIEAFLKDPVATKIIQLEHKLQHVIEKTSLQQNNNKVEAMKCVHPWKQYCEKCYLYSAGIKLTWWDALSFCRSHGAALAVPVDVTENNYVKDIARNSGEDAVWIGISDAYTEGDWLSYPLMAKIDQFTDWGPGEPSGGDGHCCGNRFYAHKFSWNDSPCNLERPFICEKHV